MTTSFQKVSDDDLIEAVKAHGSHRKAAKELGLHPSSIDRRMKRLAMRGFSPEHDMTRLVPEPYLVKGVSTLYNEEGQIAAQWVKTKLDDEVRYRLLEEAVAAMAEPIRGLAEPIAKPHGSFDNLASAYLIGDAHFGLYAWGEEAGEDFNTDIAAKDLRAAIDNLVDAAPPSETGILVDVGDFLHADNRSNMTPASGNLLDVDTRYQRVIRIAMMALRYCVARMLQKHKKVKVIITPGNHNPDSAGWMALTLAMFYESEPRVEVDTTPGKYFYHRFGNCLIGVTHGDRIKLADLPSIMATDRAKDWGETSHRYFWTGHIHHTKHQEFRGCFVESFNTLAASDAWHKDSGYRSVRQMQRIDVDPEHGIVARGICNIGMIR
jgi:hypothetical protein